MKKLSKLVLNDHSSIMNDRDMKRIVGGDDNSHFYPCVTQETLSSSYICVSNADIAEDKAGESGWWCCNCQTAIEHCGYIYE